MIREACRPPKLAASFISGVDTRVQSSRLAECGGLGMSFNICRGTPGSLAMFPAIRKRLVARE
jgi:hypothetical protein